MFLRCFCFNLDFVKASIVIAIFELTYEIAFISQSVEYYEYCKLLQLLVTSRMCTILCALDLEEEEYLYLMPIITFNILNPICSACLIYGAWKLKIFYISLWVMTSSVSLVMKNVSFLSMIFWLEDLYWLLISMEFLCFSEFYLNLCIIVLCS